MLRISGRNQNPRNWCLLAISVTAENNIKIEYTIWLSKGDYG
jgi:hypothetical protein